MTTTDRLSGATTTGWRTVTATARGAAHRARDLPNQDAWDTLAADPGEAVMAAVADGHGHARHFRSADGSRLAARVACRAAARLAGRLGQPGTDVTAVAGDELPRAIVAGWRSAVAAHLAERPYTDAELARLQASGDAPEVPYGSTLLLAMITSGWLVCAQIGDGDQLAVGPDGSSLTPVPGDDRLDGHRTTSLCQRDAIASFRVGAHDLLQTPVLAVLLATDGYGNAQAEDPWQPGVGRDLATLAAERDHHWFEQYLPSWARICASADGSGDDTTIALLLSPARAATGRAGSSGRDH